MTGGDTTGAAVRHVRRTVFCATAVFLGALAAAAVAYSLATELTGGGINQQPAVERSGGPAALPDAFRLSFWPEPRAVPDLRFADGNGRALSLADFRGRPVVLNIWATWCVPCRKEMPTLDRLQAAFGKSVLTVLPLSIDRQETAVVRQFYRQLGLKALGVYVDPSGRAASEIGAIGIPTTLLIDRGGREVGRKIGPADWDSPKMIGLLRRHLGLSGSRRNGGS